MKKIRLVEDIALPDLAALEIVLDDLYISLDIDKETAHELSSALHEFAERKAKRKLV